MASDRYATRGQTIDRWTMGLAFVGGLLFLPYGVLVCMAHLGWLN